MMTSAKVTRWLEQRGVPLDTFEVEYGPELPVLLAVQRNCGWSEARDCEEAAAGERDVFRALVRGLEAKGFLSADPAGFYNTTPRGRAAIHWAYGDFSYGVAVICAEQKLDLHAGLDACGYIGV